MAAILYQGFTLQFEKQKEPLNLHVMWVKTVLFYLLYKAVKKKKAPWYQNAALRFRNLRVKMVEITAHPVVCTKQRHDFVAIFDQHAEFLNKYWEYGGRTSIDILGWAPYDSLWALPRWELTLAQTMAQTGKLSRTKALSFTGMRSVQKTSREVSRCCLFRNCSTHHYIHPRPHPLWFAACNVSAIPFSILASWYVMY